jgi:hypothetical protein
MDRVHRGVYSTALLALGLMMLFSLGCRQGTPVVDPSPGIVKPIGTISGTVRGPKNSSSVQGRLVEVINLETNERQRATTSRAGGFTFKVKPGKYRVQVALQDGESMVKQPGVMTVNRSDVDAHADFVIGAGGVVRPRYRPSAPLDPALGFPVG